jgi:hypothetical protein
LDEKELILVDFYIIEDIEVMEGCNKTLAYLPGADIRP